jgi:hypothetical protein
MSEIHKKTSSIMNTIINSLVEVIIIVELFKKFIFTKILIKRVNYKENFFYQKVHILAPD